MFNCPQSAHIDRYYRDGHQALREFPEWAFERYLRKAVR